MTADTAALERVLSAITVRSGQARHTTLSAAELMALSPGVMTLGYVISGEATASDLAKVCTLDADSGTAELSSPARRLIAGDAFLRRGAETGVLASVSGATVMTAELDVVWPAASRALPEFLFVKGFAHHEPAAVGLTAHLAADPGAGNPRRSGDPLICRMMLTTVVLSVIRAWASAGCVPHDWPAPEGDPFLERVLRAVSDDPGHPWTLQSLSSVGAMSRTVLAERFRTAFGISPIGYVTELRMQRAKEMLDRGHSVTETSRALGYSSDEGFRRAFRRHTGVVPSQWQEHAHPVTA